jgi:hypothetical protein
MKAGFHKKKLGVGKQKGTNKFHRWILWQNYHEAIDFICIAVSWNRGFSELNCTARYFVTTRSYMLNYSAAASWCHVSQTRGTWYMATGRTRIAIHTIGGAGRGPATPLLSDPWRRRTYTYWPHQRRRRRDLPLAVCREGGRIPLQRSCWLGRHRLSFTDLHVSPARNVARPNFLRTTNWSI